MLLYHLLSLAGAVVAISIFGAMLVGLFWTAERLLAGRPALPGTAVTGVFERPVELGVILGPQQRRA